MSILIVDDFEEQREVLAVTLQQAGYRSIVFSDSAADALKRLGIGHSAPPSDHVDIVLLDLLMPDMDGLEACRRIRADERLEHLPVIVVTAKTEPSDIKAAYNAGATDYIRKPVIPAELVARVSMAMSLKEEFDNRAERERELHEQTRVLGKKVQELDTLRGSLCLCAKCKRVKTTTGIWQRLEDYLEEKLKAKVTTGVCNRCAETAPSKGVRASF
ncbi:MAG TPA: response regulator [Nitrospira sp.]|nr:response regulator [Nitrospira sp.]